jgi:hypothetical protein
MDIVVILQEGAAKTLVLLQGHIVAMTVITALLVNNAVLEANVLLPLVNAVEMEGIVKPETSVSSTKTFQMMYAAQTCNVLRIYLVDKRFSRQLRLRPRQLPLLHLQHHLQFSQLELLAPLTLTRSLGKHMTWILDEL